MAQDWANEIYQCKNCHAVSNFPLNTDCSAKMPKEEKGHYEIVTTGVSNINPLYISPYPHEWEKIEPKGD